VAIAAANGYFVNIFNVFLPDHLQQLCLRNVDFYLGIQSNEAGDGATELITGVYQPLGAVSLGPRELMRNTGYDHSEPKLGGR
jgi:hypothetical protein